MPQGATVKGQGDSGGMRGGHQCSLWQLYFAPYQLPPQPSSSQWSSWSQSCPHPSGGRCSVGKKEAGGHGSVPQMQTGGSSETHQEVLDLGPQHLELHQAQFVAAVFLWHQFRSRRLLIFTPPPLNRKSHRPHLPSTGSHGFTRRHRSMPRKQLGPPYWPDITCSSGVTSSSERIHPAD